MDACKPHTVQLTWLAFVGQPLCSHRAILCSAESAYNQSAHSSQRVARYFLRIVNCVCGYLHLDATKSIAFRTQQKVWKGWEWVELIRTASELWIYSKEPGRYTISLNGNAKCIRRWANRSIAQANWSRRDENWSIPQSKCIRSRRERHYRKIDCL